MTDFWLNDLTVLWDSYNIKQIWPTNEMNTELKLNAITRLIIIMSFLAYILTLSMRFISLGLLSLCVVIIIYKYNTITIKKKIDGFSNLNENDEINTKTKIDTFDEIKNLYKTPKSNNPFSNTLVGSINMNNDKPAPPAFNNTVNNTIIDKTKELIKNLNPDIPDINDKLYGNLVDNFNFEQSLRPFYSTPNTNIATDQETFVNFLYGDMGSCKDKLFNNKNPEICENIKPDILF
jgi:hypothetical protein